MPIYSLIFQRVRAHDASRLDAKNEERTGRVSEMV